MQEHYRLADDVSEDEANLILNNAARKVIKDTFKHARCIFVASYYTQVNLLPFCMQVLKLLIFYFDMQM
jgi:magnesium-transporting ATPase (P-type)